MACRYEVIAAGVNKGLLCQVQNLKRITSYLLKTPSVCSDLQSIRDLDVSNAIPQRLKCSFTIGLEVALFRTRCKEGMHCHGIEMPKIPESALQVGPAAQEAEC